MLIYVVLSFDDLRICQLYTLLFVGIAAKFFQASKRQNASISRPSSTTEFEQVDWVSWITRRFRFLPMDTQLEAIEILILFDVSWEA
jgi:hypothetical protein